MGGHSLHATPHGEKPMSVKEYELTTGEQVEIWKQQHVEAQKKEVNGSANVRGDD